MTRRARFGTVLLLVAPALLAGCSTGATSVEPSLTTASTAPSSTVSAAVSPTSTPTSPAASASPTAAPVKAASCSKGFTAAKLRACITSAQAIYVATWATDLAAAGISGARPPRVVIFSAPPVNPCLDLSEGDAATASFWCGKDNTVYVSATAGQYWTVDYAREAAHAHVLASDATTAGTSVADLRTGYPLVGATTEFAHELGHWAQESSGQMAWYKKRMASSSFATSNSATVSSELAADCMAGWVQGRTAVDGTWVDTRIGAWAHHATMAELGGDLSAVKANFTFPAERPADIIGYGSASTRLHFYDLGNAAGRAARPGLATCARAAATFTGSPVPPNS